MDVDNVELKISTDLDEEIRLKVDYYFSDINLNYNKYLRNLLKQSSNNEISLEELMKFHAIHHLVNGDEELLFKHLCDLKCENACFVPESRTITRNPDKPFVFDKNYFKNLSSNIVYAGNLSPNTTVSSLSQWASRYGHCSILPLKREKNCIAIQSALIVFDLTDSVQKLLDDYNNQTVKFVQDGIEHDVIFSDYGEYLKKRNKNCKLRKRKQNSPNVSNQSVDPDSSNDSGYVKKPSGMIVLATKRSLLLTLPCFQPFQCIKEFFSQYGVIYQYSFNKSCNYFLLFKNRNKKKMFMNSLEDNPVLKMEMQLSIDGDTKDKHVVLIDKCQFTNISSDSLPYEFFKYVKNLKSFYNRKYTPTESQETDETNQLLNKQSEIMEVE